MRLWLRAPAIVLTGLLGALAEPVASADDKEELYASCARAAALEKKGDFGGAAGQYERALELAPRVVAPDAEILGSILNNLAEEYSKLGLYAKAEPLYERSIEIKERALGPSHPSTALSINNLANLQKNIGHYSQADSLYQRSLKIREEALGADHAVVGESLGNLAILYQMTGDYARAKSSAERCLQIFEAKLGPNHPNVANALDMLGVLCQQRGEFAKSEQYYERSLKIRQAALGADHLDLASSYNSLAMLFDDQGDYARAEAFSQQSLKITESRLGPNHPTVAARLSNLATVHNGAGQYAKAEPLYRRSLSIYESTFGPKHPDVAATAYNLAILSMDLGRYAEAEQLLQRSLDIYEAALGPDHPDVARSLNGLASVYDLTGEYAKAEPLYRRSLAILEAKWGSDHPAVAANLNNFAGLYLRTGQYALAEPLLERSLKIDQAADGLDHPAVALDLNNLAVLHAAMGNSEQAATELDRERRIVRRHVARVLPALSEREQITFLENKDQSCWHIALTLGLKNPRQQAIVTRSAAWLVNGKAVGHETLAERTLLARDSKDPAVAVAAAQLRELRSQLAGLSQFEPPAAEAAAHRERIAALSEKEQELARRVHLAAGRVALADPWVEIDDLRKSLAPGTLLVDIVRFRPTVFGAKGQEKCFEPARYVAWLIPPEDRGEIKIVDLGAAETIDAAVERVRAGMADAVGAPTKPGLIAEHGEPEATTAIGKPLAELASLALAPISKEAGDVRQLILSPDASLWLAPWAALPLADGRYAIEEYQIRYVVTARDLVARGESKTATNRPVIMANPNFELGPAEAHAATRAVLRGAAPGGDLPLRGWSAGALIGSALPLPGTGVEAKAIAPKLAALAHAEPILYVDRYALEGVFEALKQPKIVVMSTHGFFLPDQQPRSKDERRSEIASASDAARAADGQPIENPLVRCGLLLAGCNRRDKSADGNDGILTGMEIVGTDLRGTELVVLSACETGLGQIRNGEGVAGLRQAFQLAGAKAVVSTLWQIPDRQSAVLMSDFFTALAAKKDHAEALREAQLAMIQRRRDKNGAAHPLFWAAFTITGR